MKLTNNEKQIVDDVIKRYIVDREPLDLGDDSENGFDDEFGTNPKFDKWLYDVLESILNESLNPMNFWQNDWSNDLENCIRSNAHYIKCVKESKERYNLNQIKKDF
jgi:hypothetical protein